MNFEIADYSSSGSQSVGTLSDNLKTHGYNIRYGVALIPMKLAGDKDDIIELKWEMELGSGKTLHYWYYTLQKWKIWDVQTEIDIEQINELIEESYIYFYRSFMNDSFHSDAISNMVLPKRPSDADGFHLQNTLTRLEAVISNLNN